MKKTYCLLLVVFILLSSHAFGQRPEHGGPPPRQEGPAGLEPPPGEARPEEINQLIEWVRLARLAKHLELNDEQTIVLMRRFEENRSTLQQLNEERRNALRELQALLQQPGEEIDFESALERIKHADEKIAHFRLTAIDRLGEGLSPVQRAKLYVFMQRFDEDIRLLVERSRGIGQAWRGRREQEGMGHPGAGPFMEGMRGNMGNVPPGAGRGWDRDWRNREGRPEEGDMIPPEENDEQPRIFRRGEDRRR